MNVKIKKLNENAVIPSYSKEGDAGMDLTATSISIKDTYIEYGTGLAFEIPEGYVGLLFPRSSVSKKDLFHCTGVSVIDSGYRGEVTARFKASINHRMIDSYKLGDRIAQIIIVPYPQITFKEVEVLSDTQRGVGGYGSTGK